TGVQTCALPIYTLPRLTAFAGEHPNEVCQPIYQERPKHPIVFPKTIFDELSVCAAGTLKEFLLSIGKSPAFWSRAKCAIDDPGLEFDMDEPKDYKRAYRLSFGTAP